MGERLVVLTGRETPDEAKAVRVQRKSVIFKLREEIYTYTFACFFNDWVTYAVLLFFVFCFLFSIFAWFSS